MYSFPVVKFSNKICHQKCFVLSHLIEITCSVALSFLTTISSSAFNKLKYLFLVI